MLLKFFSNILLFYFILCLFSFCLYVIFYINTYVFYVILTLILLIGIIKDKRFKLFRKILFILFLLFQLIISLYLDIIPILLIKDIFWFSLLINVSFIWHYLILVWLYDYFKKKDQNYICFLISRFSLLTSLSLINILLSSFFLLNNNIKNYYLIKVNRYKYILFIVEVFKLFLIVLYKINNYFMFIFSNYSLLLLGKNNKIKFNKDLLKSLSIYIRVIFINIFFNKCTSFIYNLSFFLIKYLYIKLKTNLYIYYKSKYSISFLMSLYTDFDIDLKRNQELVIDNNFLLKHDISLDFILYTLDLDWTRDCSVSLFIIYDVLSLFLYDKSYRIKVYVKFIVFFNDFQFDFDENNKDLIEDLISRNLLNCNFKKCLEVYNILKEEGYFNYYDLQKKEGLTIWKYMLGPKKGRYYNLF